MAEVNDFINAIIAAATANAQAANAQAAAAMNAQAAAVNQPAQQQAPQFARFPGAASAGALDFSKSESIKLFNKATAPVEPKYDLDEGKLRIFVDQVRQRAKIYNWEGILQVPDSNGTPQNIITHYGKLSIDNCIDYATTYINTETRSSQDSIMLFQFLRNSLTDEARLLMMSDEDVYTIGGEADGIVFFKLIVGRASIDTNAKTNMIRQKIANLKHAMRDDFKGNVRDFNVHVASLRDQLLGRGQQVDELVTHLFDAYTDSVPNEEFKRYIEMHRNMFDDGLELSSEQLMRHALTKYDTINQRSVTKQEGEPTVLALQAAAPKQEKKSNNDFIKSLIAKLGESKGKKSPRKVPNWKKKEPAEKEPSTKTVNGKKYHWCPKHKLWTIHTPNDCTLQLEGETNQEQKSSLNNDPTLALSKALLGMMNEDDDE
jgi:hypothetical protein